MILRQPWTQQPQGALVIDRAHFAAPRLASEGIWLPGQSSNNLATGAAPSSSSRTIEGSPVGPTAAFASQYIDTGIANTMASTGVTMIVLVRGDAAPSSTPSATGPLYSGSAGIVWDHTNASYRGAFFIYGSGAYPVASFGALSGSQWYVLGGTASSEKIASYVDGRLINSTTSGWGTGGQTGTLKIARHPSLAQYFAGKVAFALKLDRQLTDAQMLALGTPQGLWRLFGTRSIWVPVSSGGGGGFNAAWARQRSAILGAGMR